MQRTRARGPDHWIDWPSDARQRVLAESSAWNQCKMHMLAQQGAVFLLSSVHFGSIRRRVCGGVVAIW
jgi:hypothetical protein